MQKARIILASTDVKRLDEIARDIKKMALNLGVAVSGPIPLPTKRLRVTTRKSPCGDGTETYEKWEMRIHKRLLDVAVNERVLRRIMRIQVPEGIHISIELKD